MDKRKLVNIIVKDLEEIKVLSEEVAENEGDSALVIDLALYRGKLLCQELELLRELAGNSHSIQQEEPLVSEENDQEEETDLHFPDPELEILNFDQQDPDFSVTDQMSEGEESDEELEDEEEEEDDLVEEEDDFSESIEEDLEEIEEEDLEEEMEEEEEEEEDFEEETAVVEEKAVPEVKAPEKQAPAPKIQITELKNTPIPGVREIHIDDLDEEDDIEPVRIPPLLGATGRPPMREIPKPDFLTPQAPENGKMVLGEKYHKERSLNDSIAEKKPAEAPLINNHITNLKAAIGLNDRFLFIREIFGNNTEKYNQVIDHLDKLERIQEAVEYLKANLSMQKNEASMKFVDLLKRRFTS